MHDRRRGNLAHLERHINTGSSETGDAQATAGRLRRLVAISALATILDGLDLDGQPRLAFKGGASMEMRFGVTARASRLRTGWEGFTSNLRPGRRRADQPRV